jgi:glycosyltransferase involved in cell wall biosynthesis
MDPLRFVLDLASPSSVGGETLKAELAEAVDRALPPGCQGFVLCRPEQAARAAFEHLEAIPIETPLASRLQKQRWQLQGLPHWVDRLEVDVTFAASGYFSRRLHLASAVVTTTNNMLPFMPGPFGPRSLAARGRQALQRAVTVRCLRRAERVLLHSRHALHAIEPYVPGLAAKTIVTPTGIPRDARLPHPAPEHPYGGRPYFLYFSPLKPYKNHLLLIEAYRQLLDRCGSGEEIPDLLFIGHGSSTTYRDQIESTIRAGSLDERVRYLGELPRGPIVAWLHHATVNVFPSLCETSSLIQAEILGAGGVMAASDLPPMNEMPRGTAVFFDPYEAGDIAGAMERLWLDAAASEALRESALREAPLRTWAPCGSTLWRLADEAMGERRSSSRRGSG